jgi:hypothetical protein
MSQQHTTLRRSLIAGLVVCAIAPAAAVAQPIEGQGHSTGVGPAVAAQDLRAPDQVAGGSSTGTQDKRAPDQVDGRGMSATPSPTAPQWPVDPKPITSPRPAATVQSSDDGGVDTGIWIALGGAALLAAGGIGLAGRKRLQLTRRSQLA